MNRKTKPQPSFRNKQLIQLKRAIIELSAELPSVATSDCSRFKKEQLLNILNGNYLNFSTMHELPEELVKSKALNSFSHLSAMEKELIQCDFEGPGSNNFVSVLDIHNSSDSWCGACASEPSKEIKLDSGLFNPYVCWRRSHTSGNLGFLMTSELKFGSGGSMFLSNQRTFVSSSFAAQAHGRNVVGSLEWDSDQLGPSTSMVHIVHVNTQQSSEHDELIEIEGLLGQQLLHTRRMKEASRKSSKYNKLRNERIPSFLVGIIKATHDGWVIDGPSKNSMGLLAICIVNNGCAFAETSAFQTTIQNLCSELRVKFTMYNLPQVSDYVARHLFLNKEHISDGTFSLVMVLDPIIDLGGHSL
jgi:hypothetical protein